MIKFLDSTGVAYLWRKVKALVEGFANYTHPITSGNRHIPAGGASGQVLKWSADGTAEWGKENGGGLVVMGGAYATVDALAAGVANPAVGDQYNVGNAPPYRVYRWTGQSWEDQGVGLQGPAGADGKDAPPAVYVGEEAPTGGEVVWVDTDEQGVGLTGEDIPVSATDDTRIDVAIAQAVRQTLLAAYPIGAIYMSAINTNPSDLLGRTWETWGAGRVPVGVDATQPEFNRVGKTGGEAKHILRLAEMPKHNHYGAQTMQGGVTVGPFTGIFEKYTGSADENRNVINTTYSGGNTAHNNLQPYITCYMWKRIA